MTVLGLTLRRRVCHTQPFTWNNAGNAAFLRGVRINGGADNAMRPI